MLCTTEAAPACEAVAAAEPDVSVVLEAAGTTVDRFQRAENVENEPADAWVTADPWPSMVDEARAREGRSALFGDLGDEPLARSPLVMVGRVDRLDVLSTYCDRDVTWACLGTVAGAEWSDIGGDSAWGRVRVGYDETAQTAGLLVAGQAVASWFGDTQVATNSFDAAFESWFRALEQSSDDADTGAGRTHEQFLGLRGRSHDVIGGIEAEVAPAVARAADRELFDVVVSQPVTSVDLLVATLPGRTTPGDELLEQLREELASRGWRVAGMDLVADIESDLELPDDNGTLRPGVLEALRTR